ncbi:fatty acyl-CoA reductase wat-like [Plodia interpunctella]|uniref:fatty acyl-CoA reductase wat-like n=1 Tax=Plodia interpunctella TaxID=58824 RepID=UPI002367D4F6|nr:fatty acyl-CoA reductase wat-like [Plodia interpunctella]XP_053622063.1 fatty acyl-CoA reductase wat-like [Plodia interpunctella]XP_053622064.1 fatty acyl-CoA reductase wat-like [Plodia interpunctella]
MTVNTRPSTNMESNIISERNYVRDCTGIDVNMNEKRLTSVQQFYNGKNVLITGATGFLGKILVEKLLRCCPGVENLYLLVRQKKGKDIYTRIDEIFDDPVFDLLKEQHPKFRHKVVVVPADCEVAGLGLTLTDRQMLTEKVNIIFHSAATVKFDEHLRAALNTNVRAPLHLLRLARDMKDLDVLMHISTAYSNSHLPHIEERFYPCEADCEQLHRMIDKLTDGEIDALLPTILGAWPNTYTFTKALAEKELRENAGDLPVGIFRPAIVTSTYKEPINNWLDNMYGPTGVAVGTATGILRTLQCDPNVTADLVPVDHVVNCLVVAAQKVNAAYQTSKPPQEPPIFNYVSSTENRMTWGDFMRQNIARLDKTPFSNAIWYLSLRLTRSGARHRVYSLLLHLLPAALADALAFCLGKKPKMLKVYRKVHKLSSVLSYFCTTELTFCNRNTRQLWESTSDEDKKIFPFSMRDVNWDEFFEEYIVGMRRHLFKDGDDTLPQARIKWKRLYYLHQIVKILFCALAVYALWSIFLRLW